MATNKFTDDKCRNGNPSSQLVPEKDEIIIQSENTLLGNIHLDRKNLEKFMSGNELKEFIARLESFTSNLEKDPSEDIQFQGFMDSFLDYDRLEKLTESFLSRSERMIPSQKERTEWFELLEVALMKLVDKSQILHDVVNSTNSGLDNCYLVLNLSMLAWYIYKYHKARDAQTGLSIILLVVSLWIARGPLEWLCAKSNYAILNSRENFTEVQIPQYSYFHSRNNSEEAVNGSDFGRGNMNDTISSPFVVSFTEAKQDPAARATLSGSILRAGADDCNMSFFVSIPPMKAI